MTVRDRLQVLHDENYNVKHKCIGIVEMDEMDFIRIRGIEKGHTTDDYCEFIYSNTLTKSNIIQNIDEDILNKEIVKEEVLMIGADCSLDMYVNID